MTFVYFLVTLSVLALAALLLLIAGYWFPRHRRSPTPSELRAIDVNAFRNLIDEQETAYLREHLPRLEFRRVHRERMLAAVEYVWAAFGNIGILVSVAEAARTSSNPQIAEAAERLFENATRLRWHTFRVMPGLYWSMLFPGVQHASRHVFDRYDAVTRQALVLGSMAVAARSL